MFGQMFNRSVFAANRSMLLRRASTESAAQNAAQLLPAWLANPLCKVAKFSSFVWYQTKVVYNVGKIVLRHQGYRIPTRADFTAAEEGLMHVVKNLRVSWGSRTVLKDMNYKKAGIVAGELVSLFVV
ncbi:hypothetical protein BB560_002655, partial [Smittium megazygosporum]